MSPRSKTKFGTTYGAFSSGGTGIFLMSGVDGMTLSRIDTEGLHWVDQHEGPRLMNQ
jgi:hypothetical protein